MQSCQRNGEQKQEFTVGPLTHTGGQGTYYLGYPDDETERAELPKRGLPDTKEGPGAAGVYFSGDLGRRVWPEARLEGRTKDRTGISFQASLSQWGKLRQ